MLCQSWSSFSVMSTTLMCNLNLHGVLSNIASCMSDQTKVFVSAVAVAGFIYLWARLIQLWILGQLGNLSYNNPLPTVTAVLQLLPVFQLYQPHDNPRQFDASVYRGAELTFMLFLLTK